jgi:tetratricopeptide (TPR) repeat protein
MSVVQIFPNLVNYCRQSPNVVSTIYLYSEDVLQSLNLNLGERRDMSVFSLATSLTIVANAIFLAYLIVFAVVRQSTELYIAVAAEIGVYALLLSYRFWRGRSKSHMQEKALVASVELSLPLVRLARRCFAGISVTVLLLAALYAALDFTGLLLAAGDKDVESKKMYSTISPTIIGMYPGLTLQLLAGAHIERKDFKRARELESMLLELRRDAFGAASAPVAEMYSDIADLETKLGDSVSAESNYRKAIDLTLALRLPQGYGSPMTKLACLLREQRRHDEAEACFKDALEIRSRIFGVHSAKVAETQVEYAKLLEVRGDGPSAQTMQRQAASILLSSEQREAKNDSQWFLAFAPAIMFLLFALLRRPALKLVQSNLTKRAASARMAELDS